MRLGPLPLDLSLSVTNLLLNRHHSFGGLQQPATSGMGLQNAVRTFLAKNHKQLLDELEFDSESSMFCVRSKSLQPLGVVAEAIFTIAANAKDKHSS